MNAIRLLFGRPVIRGRAELISKLRDLQTRHGCVIQALDADKVVSERHLTFATEKALLAFSEGRNIARDLGVEILRYASGERQIERALAIGVSDSTERIVLILASPLAGNKYKWPDASELSGVVELDGQVCSFNARVVRAAFNISSEEVGAVGEARIPDLVLERVALVDTYR